MTSAAKHTAGTAAGGRTAKLSAKELTVLVEKEYAAECYEQGGEIGSPRKAKRRIRERIQRERAALAKAEGGAA